MKLSFSARILILLFTCFTLINFTCDEDPCENILVEDRTPYSAQLNTTASTFQVNDTIKLSINLDSQIELEVSGNTKDISDNTIGIPVYVFEATSGSNTSVGAISKFDFFGEPGSIFTAEIAPILVQLSNRCRSSSCEINLGIITKEPGFYGFALRPGSVSEDADCENITLMQDGFEGIENNNFEIFEEINLSNIRIDVDLISDPGADPNLFFFKVE